MVFPLLVSPKQLPEYSPLCLFFTLFFYYFLMPLRKTLARYFFGNRQDIEISCFPHCLHTIVMRKVPTALESKHRNRNMKSIKEMTSALFVLQETLHQSFYFLRNKFLRILQVVAEPLTVLNLLTSFFDLWKQIVKKSCTTYQHLGHECKCKFRPFYLYIDIAKYFHLNVFPTLLVVFCIWRENLQIRQEVLTLKCNWNSLKICGALWDNLTCDQALFSFRSVKHSGGKGETKNRA